MRCCRRMLLSRAASAVASVRRKCERPGRHIPKRTVLSHL
jgi:hypothetical protein